MAAGRPWRAGRLAPLRRRRLQGVFPSRFLENAHAGPDADDLRPCSGVAMFDKLRNWRVRRIVARHPIAEPLWQDALQRCAPARRLGASDQATLRVLATLFLESKSLEPIKGLELDDADRVLLATHACVPILKLGLDWYDGWHSVIVYPDAFIPRRTQTDAAGVVHQTNDRDGRRGLGARAGDPVVGGRAAMAGGSQGTTWSSTKWRTSSTCSTATPTAFRRCTGAWIAACGRRSSPARGIACRRSTATALELPIDPYAPGKPGRVLRGGQRAVFRGAGRPAPASAGGVSAARAVLPAAPLLNCSRDAGSDTRRVTATSADTGAFCSSPALRATRISKLPAPPAPGCDR